MSALLTRLRSAATALPGEARGAAVMVLGTRRRHADARAMAICPVDSLPFTPLYSNGRCPICGFTPEGYRYRAPALSSYERFWGGLAAMAVLSVLMGFLVMAAYTHA